MNCQLSPSSLRSRALPALFFLLVMACGDSGALIGPGNQLEVVNNTDAFAFQVSALDNVTQTLSYPWTITGPDATVDIAGSVASGTATVTITDAQGVEVFSRDLDGSSNPSTSSGTAGSWTILVTLDGVSGTFGIASSANNVLAEPRHATALMERGIIYGPDYLVNSGGLIRCQEEVRGRGVDDGQVLQMVSQIYDQTLEVIRTADERGISTAEAADRMAEERIANAQRRKRRGKPLARLSPLKGQTPL